MKRVVMAGVCALFALNGVFAGAKKEAPASKGTQQEAPESDASLQNVLAKKKLILGLDDSFPPMGFRNESNEIVGYDVDLAREVASRLGIELVLQPIDWNAKEQELNTGEIDCIWNGFTITEERKAALTFTKPYLKNAQVIVVKADAAYTTLQDLAGKTAGLQAGSSSVEALNESTALKASLKEVIEYKEYLTALMDLEVGGVDAIIMDLVVANDNITRSGKAFRILEETLAPEEFGIGFRKGDLALANKVWETLEAMAHDGTVSRLTAKWFGADISIIGK
ncbi:MAG: amino acid ABC transporter substrate-binding protein [Treponema sp.]|jgi:polar amino acid transport system substrate-binding protein|nr:amino acid ABC transporter substrate-binding protein [Treponema sp.]